MLTINSFSKRSRSGHIHACRRREAAKQHGRKQIEMLYCYFCFTWINNGMTDAWRKHCGEHLDRLGPLDCDRITYGSSQIKPHRCGACVGDIPAENILREFSPHRFWLHLEQDHILQIQFWPSRCLYHGCTTVVNDKACMVNHFIDCHYRSKRKSQDAPAVKRIGLKRDFNHDEESPVRHSTASSSISKVEDGTPLDVPRHAESGSSRFVSPSTDEEILALQLPANRTKPVFLDPALKEYHVRGIELGKPPGPKPQVSEGHCGTQSPTGDLRGEPVHHGAAVPQRLSDHSLVVDDPASLPRQDEWPVEDLLAKWKRGKSVFYLVKWLGFGDEQNSWVSAKDVGSEAIDRFEATFDGNDAGVDILDKRLFGKKLQYFLRWKGRPMAECSWENLESISRSRVASFEQSFAGNDVGVELIDKRINGDFQVEYRVEWTGRPSHENSWIGEALIKRSKIESFNGQIGKSDMSTNGHGKRKRRRAM
jgi:hypothetical protein